MFNHYAVVDCETTGFGKLDRIVEIAVVVLDAKTLAVTDEFESLVNPMRDVGRSDIHGVKPAMVASAPLFEELANGIATRLNGAVLVGHNLSFDSRFVTQECARSDLPFDAGVGVCTYRITGDKLASAAVRHGIQLDAHHCAMADARATAALFREVMEDPTQALAACMMLGKQVSGARTLRRDATSMPLTTPLARLLSRACYPSSLEACVAYFEMLDCMLADGALSADERGMLDAQIHRLALSPSQVRTMHESYLQSIIRAIERDSIVSTEERSLVETVARALELDDLALPTVTVSIASSDGISAGSRICFTGAAQRSDGSPIERHELESLAARIGCQPVAGVSKKGCDLLVAADPLSQSGKAQKARQSSVRVIGVDAFLAFCGV